MANNISIVWDFDKTLTSHDSTTELIRFFIGNKTQEFWDGVKKTSGVDASTPVDSISTSEAPVWMYLLSEMATNPDTCNKIALDEKHLGKLIAEKIRFYPNVLEFLKKIKSLSSEKFFKKNDIEIHHFIITAGLQDLVSSVFKLHGSRDLIREIFGCRYKIIQDTDTQKVEKNIPIYCMDKTAKTRALFEICKGCFSKDAKYKVDDLVPKEDEWCSFENMIYIGDGDTDIPAFSLVRSRRGVTIGVYNPDETRNNINSKAENIRKGRRIDLFTPAEFTETGELFRFIKIRCEQIAKRYEAHQITD
ncbi:MAG: HAD family hydrolase [Bdellovibrionales bacterium]|nr:HAD family hydrolase [Bdellovibrionales bacterium]